MNTVNAATPADKKESVHAQLISPIPRRPSAPAQVLWEGPTADMELDMLAESGINDSPDLTPLSSGTSGTSPRRKAVRFGEQTDDTGYVQPVIERRGSVPRVPTPHPREFALLVLKHQHSAAADQMESQ